jgi:aspartate beta-hydroxylase
MRSDVGSHRAVRQGLWAVADQRPIDYWLEGGHQPVYDPGDFWFVGHLEANYDAIRAEIDAALGEGRPGFAPVDEPLLGEGKWDQVVLYEAGRRQDRACELFPVTAAVIEQIPEATTFGPGVVTLSWLEPGSHIVAHCGRTNAQIRLHLGLRVPDGASMRVGEHTLTWEEGRCLLFDDSYEHEVWHRGDQPRLVLLLDVLNPCLDTAQRARALARRASSSDQIASYLAEHDIDRVETDERGVVLRPSAGMSALVRRYMAETGATMVERHGRELRFEYAEGQAL